MNIKDMPVPTVSGINRMIETHVGKEHTGTEQEELQPYGEWWNAYMDVLISSRYPELVTDIIDTVRNQSPDDDVLAMLVAMAVRSFHYGYFAGAEEMASRGAN